MQRYSRQIILPEIGIEGQKCLHNASVLCIGAGGLGSPALLYLAAAGVGRIGIVDDDCVDVSNLQRQILFNEEDVGQRKVDVAQCVLQAMNTHITIKPYATRFTAENAEHLLQNYDVVIDGTDNFASKFLINDACVKYKKPLIYGSILGFEAQVSVFSATHGACYRCLHPEPPKGHIPNCAEAGVIGAMAGIAGTVQALEAIKMLLGVEWCAAHNLQPLLGRVWLLDARSMDVCTLTLHKNPNCPVCSKPHDEIVLHAEVQVCVDHNIGSISMAELNAFEGAHIIDVREPHECAQGMIEGAENIPLEQLLQGHELPRNCPLIIYCQHGMRSQRGAQHLLERGYQDVMHIEGGYAQFL